MATSNWHPTMVLGKQRCWRLCYENMSHLLLSSSCRILSFRTVGWNYQSFQFMIHSGTPDFMRNILILKCWQLIQIKTLCKLTLSRPIHTHTNPQKIQHIWMVDWNLKAISFPHMPYGKFLGTNISLDKETIFWNSALPTISLISSFVAATLWKI